MRFTGQGPQGFPGQQGPGGMAPPMNPMQKSGMAMQQGQPGMSGQGGPQPMSNPGGLSGGGLPPALQAFQNNNNQAQANADELSRVEQQLIRAQMFGADPYTIAMLQKKYDDLQAQMDARRQAQMARDQKQFNNMTAANSAPGIGRGTPNTYSPGYQAAARNQNLDQQLIAAIIGGGGGGGLGKY